MGVLLADGVIFDFSGSKLSVQKLALGASSLEGYINELSAVVSDKDWSHPAASFLLPFEKKYASECASLAKKLPSPSLVIVVGIGGSNLGTMAVHDAIFGSLCNLNSKPQLVFADTTDARTLNSIIELAKSHFSKGGHVIINIVSKSGHTIETIANFDVLYSSLSAQSKDRLHVVATSDESCDLEKLALSEGFDSLQIPKNVGGRYSVFSNVGLFPLSLCGVDINSLLEGARMSAKSALSTDISKNNSALMASFLYANAKKGKRTHVDMLFSNSLHSTGMWHRQLLAESSAKQKNIQGKIVHSGITPICSVCTTDLHSMAQLYLGGPDDKTYRIITASDKGANASIGKSALLHVLAPQVQGKSINQIMDSICGGVICAFKKGGREFVHINLPSLNAHSIGWLMQEEMAETMYLCHLLGVNAFDQPAVEEYKSESIKILKKST